VHSSLHLPAVCSAPRQPIPTPKLDLTVGMFLAHAISRPRNAGETSSIPIFADGRPPPPRLVSVCKGGTPALVLRHPSHTDGAGWEKSPLGAAHTDRWSINCAASSGPGPVLIVHTREGGIQLGKLGSCRAGALGYTSRRRMAHIKGVMPAIFHSTATKADGGRRHHDDLAIEAAQLRHLGYSSG
jgi:hypothetical protein